MWLLRFSRTFWATRHPNSLDLDAWPPILGWRLARSRAGTTERSSPTT